MPPFLALTPPAAETPISVERLVTFEGPFELEKLLWIGGGLFLVLGLLALRDALLAKRKWVVPALFTLRAVACVGVLLALSAPTSMTRLTFEQGRGLGIYLDTSASMNLSDPADGQGHMVRWHHAAAGKASTDSLLSIIDTAASRIDTALALVINSRQVDRQTHATLQLLDRQIEHATDVLTKHEKNLPYPALGEEVRNALDATRSGQLPRLIALLPSGKSKTNNSHIAASQDFGKKLDALKLDLGEWQKRLAVIARELARREESAAPKLAADKKDPARINLATALLRRAEKDTLSAQGDDLEILRSGFSKNLRNARETWQVKADQLATSTNASDNKESSAGPVTNLNSALAEIATQYRDGRIDAAVLVTDGIHNTPGSPLEIPPILKDFPLLVVPAGGDYQLDDVALWRAVAPETLMRGDFLSVDCLVGARGYENRTTRVRLLDENGKELDATEVTFGSDGIDQQVRLTTAVAEVGFRRYKVEVEALEGEVQTDNNQQAITVDVFTGDLKILLADGWPRWETRYLSNLLKRDDTTEHQEILFAPEPPDPMPDTLSLIDELEKFNIVILGDIDSELLGYGQLGVVKDFVNEGGNLIVIAGREHMPGDYAASELADLLPVRLDQTRDTQDIGWQLQPTAAGLRTAALSLEDNEEQNRAVWQLGSRRLPLNDFSKYNLPKPAAQVIVEAIPLSGETFDTDQASIPYIVWHRYGAGRVFYLPSPSTYFLRYRYGDRYHYRFWGQFLRWVTMAEMRGGNARIQIAAEARLYRENETPRIEVELRDAEGLAISDADAAIQLERDGAEVDRYPLTEVVGSDGKYQVTLPALGHGEYRIRAVGTSIEALLSEIEAASSPNTETGARAANESGFLVVARHGSETGDRTCDWETIHRLGTSTAGAVVPPNALEAALEVLTSEQTRSYREEITRIPMWDRWPLFFFILSFLSVEWAGRKYAGLI